MIDVASFFSLLASTAREHPYIAAVIALLWLASNAWKAIPRATREALEQRAPRPVGILRVVLQLTADLFGAARTLFYQVLLGQPRPPQSYTAQPDDDEKQPARADDRDADAPTGHALDPSTLPGADDAHAALERDPDTPRPA